MKFYLHVNYYEGEGKLEKLFKLADMNGYDGVELRGKYNFSDMTQKQYRDNICALKQKYPELGISFGTYVELLNEQQEAKNNIAEYLDFFGMGEKQLWYGVYEYANGATAALGADYREFDRNGSSMAKEEDYKKITSGLKVIAGKANELEMTIALETHVCYIHDLPDSCAKLMKQVDDKAIGLNFDYGNIYSNKNGCSIKESIDLIGDKIYYVHLKNLKKCENGLRVHASLEEGHINNCEILERLKAINFNGVVVLEYPASGDGIIASRRDMQYINVLKEWLEL